MKRLKKQYWGWGIRVDAEGNFSDVFPNADNSSKTDETPQKKPRWHVKRKSKQCVAPAR